MILRFTHLLVRIGLRQAVGVDDDVSQGLSFLHMVIGHQCQQLVLVGPGQCPGAVGPRVARDDSLGIGERLHHPVDHLGLDLMAEVVVGYVQAYVQAQFGESCVQDRPGADAVGVEVGDDDERHGVDSEVLQCGTHGVDVFEQRVGRVVDLFEIFISPAHALPDEVEQFEAGVGTIIRFHSVEKG